MSQNTTNYWGQDIVIAIDGQAKIAANGELILTDGVDTGVQDIMLRLFTRLGSLFYDREFGSLIHDWILEESTTANRAALCAEIAMRVEADPRVVLGTVRCSVLKWDEMSIVLLCQWHFIDEDHPLNLVMQADKLTRQWIVADVNPTIEALRSLYGGA